MLDSSDREFIRKEIQEALNPKEDKSNPKTKDPLTLNMKDVVTKIGDSANNIRKSKLGKGAIDALLYSNVITAAIANNSDILKALGKGTGKLLSSGAKLIKDNIRNKSIKNNAKSYPLVGSSAKMLPRNTEKLVSMNSTNYIMAKNAMFVGGKNYININMPTSKMSSFNLPMNVAEKLPDSRDKLNLPAGPVLEAKLIKNNKAQLLEAKTTNKLLGLMNNRMMLIVGGVLLAGAAITGLAAWLYDKFKKGKPSGNKIKSDNQIKLFEQQSRTPRTETVQAINNGINKEVKPTDVKEFNKMVTIGNTSYDTGLRSGYTAKSKEGSVYRAPFDMKIKSFKENNRKLGVINIIAEKRSAGIDKDIEIMNITNPVVYPEQIVKKNQPIGLIGPGGDIHIKDISKKDFDSYIEDIGKYAESENKESFDISEQDQANINGYFQTLSDYKKRQPDAEVNVDYSDKRYLEQQNKINDNRNKQAIETLQDAIDKGYNGTSLYGRWIPKDKLELELNKYKGNYNKSNKNAELGLQQSKKAAPNYDNRKPETQVKEEEKSNKITVNAPTNKVRSYGLSYPMDIAAANSNTFTV